MNQLRYKPYRDFIYFDIILRCIMDTFEAISTRRAIKKFDSSYKMSSEDVKSLMEYVILSPTSYNQQNWRFVTVTDQDIKDKISIV